MMKKQVTVVATLLILVALFSNMDMVAEAKLGPKPFRKLDAVNCYDACTTGCVNPDNKKLIRCHHKCYVRCGGTEPDHELWNDEMLL
ncbi:hypothetical protein CARUB_v10010771mg [Capsella rubella]|uniref:Uncharacterized protein n=1 Tax=Capsella rubella TaxID=81985 RepID=R0GKC1_9BRAS|nr:hypothetical protein CARUB_v10010771mg [Capsella rubella]